MGMLDGKVALVIGAAARNNMCQAIAREYAREGAKVVVAGRHADILKEFAGEIGGAWTLCDITSRPQIEAMVAFTKQRYGKLDIAVNGTAKGLAKPFVEHTEADIELMLDTSFKGPFKFMQVVVQAMDHGGAIINLSSVVGTIMGGEPAYMGAKAGMDHVVRAVANEFGHIGIRVNTIAPGLTDTPMTVGYNDIPGVVDAYAKEHPLGRIGNVDDIAFAALFLASDRCFMTGQTLQVNGGVTLRRLPTQGEIEASMNRATAKLAPAKSDACVGRPQ